MKKFNILFLAVAALVVMFAGCKKDNNPSPSPTIYIYTAVQLDSVRYNLSGNYVLMNDISLADYSASEGWQPIGTSPSESFTGKFDGSGNKITNLTINTDGNAGLFGRIWGGYVSNLGVETAASGIKGGFYVGGIAAAVYHNSTVTNCYSKGSIFSSSNSLSASGGIVGCVYVSTIMGCYSTGNISFGNYTGGIAGEIRGGTIINCYSTGDITSYYYSGGIVGVVDGNGTVTNCAAINSKIDANFAGRIVGHLYSSPENGNYAITISNNFALSTMTVIGDTSQSNGGVDKTDEQLKTHTTYSDTPVGDGQGGLGWKFGNDDANPWKMPAGGGYPVLYWQ